MIHSTLPPILNPAQLRATQIAKEENQRFEEIVNQLIKILVKEKIEVAELPRVITMLTSKINQKIDKSEIEKVLKL